MAETRASQLHERAQRAARRDPNRRPFSSFLERDELREGRRRRRRRTVIISLAIHGVALAALLVYSILDVDELFGPSVEVRVFSPQKLPPGVRAGPQDNRHSP